MCFDEPLCSSSPHLGDSGYKLGNPSLGNANGATLVPPTLLPSEYRQARRKAAETFAGRRSPSRRPARGGRAQPTTEEVGRALEQRRHARVAEADARNPNPSEPVVEARLPTDFVVRRRGNEAEQE